jgi:hypothetical protein
VSQSIHAYSTSSVPLAGASRFRRIAVYTECLRCAGAPRRPTTGSVLSLRVPYRHAALYDPGESIGCLCSVLRQRPWPSSSLNPTRHSHLPHHPLPMGESFRGFPGSLFATACRFACLPGGSDRALPQPTETFTPKLSTGRSPFPLSGITTVVTEQAPPAGLAPTGTSTSIAAPSVDSKPLTWTLRPLDATLTKTRGRGLTVTRSNSDRRALRQSPRCGEPAHQFLFFLQQAAHFRGCGICLDAPLHIRELPLGLAVLQGFDATHGFFPGRLVGLLE